MNLNTMKAAVYEKYGSPSVLKIKKVEKPTPKNNEVLIRVYATTVNRTDCAMLRAKPFIMRFFTGLLKPNKPIPGTDFAGKIEAVGKDVESLKVRDKVFGFDVGTLNEVNIDSRYIVDVVNEIRRGKYKEVHSTLIFKDNKLVFEEYFKGHEYKCFMPWDGEDSILWSSLS